MLWPHSVNRTGWMSVPAPLTHPPPWNHTSTGVFALTVRGAKTLRLRQSSFQLAGEPGRQNTAACTHSGPGRVAARMPVHGATRCGGCHRPGGAAYGMPWNRRCAPCRTPRTAPSDVLTTGPAADAASVVVSETSAVRATATTVARRRPLEADTDLSLFRHVPRHGGTAARLTAPSTPRIAGRRCHPPPSMS